MYQFSDNLKIIKRKTIEWEKIKFKYSQKQVWILEEDIANIFNSNMNCIFSELELKNLNMKEDAKKELMY